MKRATVGSLIFVLASSSACKSESAPASEAAAPVAPAGAAVAEDEWAGGAAAPAAEEVAGSADNAAAAPSPEPQGSKTKESPADDADAPLPGVFEAEPIIEGNLDRDIIRRVVRSRVGDIRDCYNAGLRSDPSLRGTVTIKFTIDARGKVQQSEASDADAFPDPKVASCIANSVSDWEFPGTGEQVEISYPFTLEGP